MNHVEVDARKFAEHPLGAADLICFSHLRWNFVYQRPQHLISRAARSFASVRFIEEPIFDDIDRPRLNEEVTGDVRVVVPVLPHGLNPEQIEAAQQALLAPMLRPARRPLVFWYYTPMLLPLAGDVPPDLCIYDNMDELSAFHGAPPLLLRREEELLAQADIVFTGGRSLYEAKRERHHNVHAFPSSIDTAHFAQARDPVRHDPPDQMSLPQPRMGFFGVIDERMNLDLVAGLADAHPDWQLVMIGPVVKIDPASLPQRPNLHWLGGKRYEELPAYIGGWSVGIMPFAINAATRFISPTKTPEFLAAGVPVVSTPIVDVVRDYGDAGLVEIADDAASMAAKIRMLLDRPREPWLAQVDRHLATISWDRTWADMKSMIETALAGGEKASRPRTRSTSKVIHV